MPLVNYLDLQNEVLSFGMNDGPQVNRARVKNWINEAQFQIAREVEGPEFQVNYTFNMIAGTYSYALPADLARVQDVVYPTLSTRLRPVDIQNFDLANVAQISGPPVTYTLDQGNLFLFPNPNSTDQLLLRYIQVPATLVNDTDVPQLNTNYLHLLVRYSLVRAFEAEDDLEMAQYYQTVYEKQLDAYATDVQWRIVDRPRQVDGTWSAGNRTLW